MSDSTPVHWIDDKQAASQPVIRLSAADNVAVALRTLKLGESLQLPDQTIPVGERIMKGHKIALSPLSSGQPLIKYSQVIGVASQDIQPGDHVHTHNLAFVNQYDRRSDAQEHGMVGSSGLADKSDAGRAHAAALSEDTFMGFARADGRAGTRNYVAVISSVNCSATLAHHIAHQFESDGLQDFPNVDGVAAFTHGTGCGMDSAGEGFACLQRVLAGYARHPNVGAVLIVGLGCETSQIAELVKAQKLGEGPLLSTMNIQTSGGHRRTLERGVSLIRDMLAEINLQSRTPCSASELALALQCGGSDAWSGITANPALGYAADLLVKQGGTAVLAETPEIYGAEHLLTARAANPDVAKDLDKRIAWWQEYVARNNGSLDNNPSPGNKLGGLTTILEKSLGAVAKGGTTPLNGVYEYAQPVTERGFVFMDTPGYDPVSVTGQIAGGCNLVAFTTGRGSTFGSKPAPSLKIATNTDMYQQMQEDMDINAGTIVSDADSIEAVGERIYRRLLEVASGDRTTSEQHGLGNNEFVPWQIGATM